MLRSIATIFTIAAASAAAMACIGCSNRPDAQPAAPRQPVGYRRAWSDDDVVKPDWLANPTRNGTVMAAWGSCVHDPVGGRGAMRDRALASARQELARMVKVRVQSVLQDYLAESGGSAGGAVVTFTQSVSRTVADQSVGASYQRDEWTHPKTGELFVWAVVDSAFGKQLAQTVANAAASDPAADAHARAKLASDKGFAELDRLLKDSAKP